MVTERSEIDAAFNSTSGLYLKTYLLKFYLRVSFLCTVRPTFIKLFQTVVHQLYARHFSVVHGFGKKNSKD
jgi:hypothetical protein